MKITQQQPEPQPFKPVTITLETQDEVDQLAAVLARTPSAPRYIYCMMYCELKSFISNDKMLEAYKKECAYYLDIP